MFFNEFIGSLRGKICKHVQIRGVKVVINRNEYKRMMINEKTLNKIRRIVYDD